MSKERDGVRGEMGWEERKARRSRAGLSIAIEFAVGDREVGLGGGRGNRIN